MGDFPVPGYQIFWTNNRSTLKSEHQTLAQQHPDADAQLKQFFEFVGDVEDGHGGTHISLGMGKCRWAAIVNAARENGANYCKALHGKTSLVPYTVLKQ
jgi:hypothetical protein